MKIERIELYQVDLPYSGGTYRLSAGRTYESFDASIVRITCDDGTQGWAEHSVRIYLHRRSRAGRPGRHRGARPDPPRP